MYLQERNNIMMTTFLIRFSLSMGDSPKKKKILIFFGFMTLKVVFKFANHLLFYP